MRLLVVDDDRALRDVLRRALTLAGYDVRLIDTGAGALSEVSAIVPDAVVLDVGLPDIDGLEVCRLLRREGNRVPVLMLTGLGAAAAKRKTSGLIADGYLTKPVVFPELLEVIRCYVPVSEAHESAPLRQEADLCGYPRLSPFPAVAR